MADDRMFNVLLEKTPWKWHGYPIDARHRTGIRIMQCLGDKEFSEYERTEMALNMLFYVPDRRPSQTEAIDGLEWFLNGYNHDHHKKTSSAVKCFDFDVDQWRIYSAFREQYHIDLNRVSMHWFVFMGLLTNLQECAFTRVMDIRVRKIDAKASRKEKDALVKAKEIYKITEPGEGMTPEEKAAQEKQLRIFNEFMNAGKQKTQ